MIHSLRLELFIVFKSFVIFSFKQCCSYEKWISSTYIFQLRSSIFIFLFVDHALLGHVMETVNVTDEFECHRKCIQNNTCKSFNIHPLKTNAVQKTCEMNNQTRQLKPKHFKKKIGSSYHSSVESPARTSGNTRTHKRTGSTGSIQRAQDTQSKYTVT
ncbi:hypothetical protein P5673_009414 [Acropora cervicornis]|uniref:Apple domain-containing protein n=1 Tax=Acropora cervicornis TaxID=6130 RepID=A0AAD9QSU2_ACRCE|nr:hypothetical protein P5673_009414 [Acropora cervicornis]